MKLIVALTAIALVASPTVAGKIACRDAKGRIAKCPPAAAAVDITKGKDGKCRWAKKGPGHNGGQLVKCP